MLFSPDDGLSVDSSPPGVVGIVVVPTGVVGVGGPPDVVESVVGGQNGMERNSGYVWKNSIANVVPKNAPIWGRFKRKAVSACISNSQYQPFINPTTYHQH